MLQANLRVLDRDVTLLQWSHVNCAGRWSSYLDYGSYAGRMAGFTPQATTAVAFNY